MVLFMEIHLQSQITNTRSSSEVVPAEPELQIDFICSQKDQHQLYARTGEPIH